MVSVLGLNRREYLPDKDLYFGENTSRLPEDILLSANQLIEFRNNCLAYYVELCAQIRSRFSNIEDYLKTLSYPETVLNELNTVTPLPRTFKHFTKNKHEDISSEYREILNSFNDKLKKLDFVSFWEKL
jgi:hypothetical protein